MTNPRKLVRTTGKGQAMLIHHVVWSRLLLILKLGRTIIGCPKKGRCYGFGSSQSGGLSYRGSYSSISLFSIDSDNRFNELTKELDEMRAHNARMEEETRRREEEIQKMEEATRRIEDSARRREEEARMREEERKREFQLAMEDNRRRAEDLIEETVHKLPHDVNYTNHKFPGGSDTQEQAHCDKDR